MKEFNVNLFMQLITYAFDDSVKIDDAENVDWENIYALSKHHGIANIIGYTVDKLKPKISEELYSKFRTEQLMAVRNDAIQEFEIKKLLDCYEKEGIECIVLKGTVLKKLYPSSDMRIMGDLDLLVKKEQIPLAHEFLIKNGYTEIVEENQDKQSNPHEEYRKPPVMLVELHKFLFPQAGFENIFEYYTDIWKRTEPYMGYKNIYMMNDNEFYIYMILHIMKHYKRAGTGMRSLLDIWVFLKEKTPEREYTDRVFEKLGLLKFEQHIRELAQILFDGKENNDEVYKDMTEFILGSGTYGNEKNFKTMNVSKEGMSKASRIRYIVKITFLPFESMCLLYPSLKKAPFLLPVYWVLRAFDRVTNKHNKVKNEIEMSMDTQYSKKLIKHFKNVGL